MNILEKIAIFGLLAIALVSAATVVLPDVSLYATHVHSAPMDDAFLGQ